MFGILASLMPLVLVTADAHGQPTEGLIAHWEFSSGSGTVLRDGSGQGNDGQIRGATWVSADGRPALRFARSGSYVDLGDNPALKPTGDFSFSAWISPAASPYPDGTTNWHLFCWETYRKSGIGLRIAGSDGRLYLRSNQADGLFGQGYSTSRLPCGVFTHIAVVRRGNTVRFYIDGRPDGEMTTQDPAPNHLNFTLSEASQSLDGLMANVRLYGRALGPGEIVSLFREDGAARGKDVSWVGKLRLTPFVYYDRGQATIAADFLGVLPLRPGERIRVQLRPAGGEPIDVRERETAPTSASEDFVFDLTGLRPAMYEVDVSVGFPTQPRAQSQVRFSLPQAPPSPPSPEAHAVGPLPVAPDPPNYDLRVARGGGFTVRIGSAHYPVISTCSYPHGGENRLLAGDQPDRSGEDGWTVSIEETGPREHRVVAAGSHYRLTRDITAQATRVLVRDRVENLTDADLGLALDNRVEAGVDADVQVRAPALPNPPLFVQAADHGVGMLPLNDVYQLLQRTYIEGRAGGARIAGLGIPRGGSHTLEWAVYPIATPEYFDLVNAIRRDEGLNGLTVDGCLSITHSGRWLREPPPGELIRLGGLKYASSGCVTKVADDPGISFEGIEFMRYPKEREALRRTYAVARERFPDLDMGFHVACNIYATDRPEKAFPDSMIIARSGEPEMYGNFSGYFSEERRAGGWGWFPFYPTLTNSFGRELLRSVDVMIDEIGAKMVWGDGLLTGYGPATGNYPTAFVSTFGRWDGHSVELDATTRTISRKLGQMVALGREALVAYIRKINAKGGRVWINHMSVVPRTFAREEAFWAAETNDGDHRCASLHLSPAPHGLANPEKHATAQMIYDDIRSKLSWGALYAYYWYGGAGQLTHPMITAEMYPITIKELHAGYIKGSERLITLHSGIYGWPGSRELHCAVRADARGVLGRPDFLTTVDRDGVRTEVSLGEDETAVLRRIPVTVQAPGPVNVVVQQHDAEGLRLTANGRGEALVTLTDGDFPIIPRTTYTVTTDRPRPVKSNGRGRLTFTVLLAGMTRLSVTAPE